MQALKCNKNHPCLELKYAIATCQSPRFDLRDIILAFLSKGYTTVYKGRTDVFVSEDQKKKIVWGKWQWRDNLSAV